MVRRKYATNRDWADSERRRKLAYRRERTYNGLCADCGEPKLSDWYCWDCLSAKQFGRLESAMLELGVSVEEVRRRADSSPEGALSLSPLRLS